MIEPTSDILFVVKKFQERNKLKTRLNEDKKDYFCYCQLEYYVRQIHMFCYAANVLKANF